MSNSKQFNEQKTAIKTAESLNAVNSILVKMIEKAEATGEQLKDNVMRFALVQINAELTRFESLYAKIKDKNE